LKLNGKHQFLVDTDAVNILGEIVHTVLKNTEALMVGSKELYLEVYTDKYIVMSRDQKAGRSYNIKIANSFFEKVEEFKHL
jgi:heptaprenylglyceryl phosphate synthase